MSDQLSSKELLRISKRLSDIDELGLNLGFEDAEIEAFQQENNKDLTARKGTHTMLKKWYAKDGSDKDTLVGALRESGLGKLADRVQKGILIEDTTNAVPNSTVQPGGSAGITCAPSLHDISDATLRDIGAEIGGDNLMDVGIALNIPYNKIRQYQQTNFKGAGVTSYGTIQMLFDWREKAGLHGRDRLRAALMKAECIRIQQKYLP